MEKMVTGPNKALFIVGLYVVCTFMSVFPVIKQLSVLIFP